MKLPRPLSHSSMWTYDECPRRYWFRYVEKIPEKPRHYFSYGRSMHSALEFFYGREAPPAPSLEELLKAYKRTWVGGDDAGYRDKDHESGCFEEGRAILIAFYHKHAGAFVAPLAVEKKIEILVEGVPVLGVIDRVDRLPDGRLAILDYKTGKTFGKDGAYQKTSESQLTLYQLFCETEYRCEVSRLTFYHLPTLVTQDFPRRSAALVDEVRRMVVRTAKAVENEQFDPKPQERKCLWCDYKPLCPVFRGQAPLSHALEEEEAQSDPADLEARLSRMVDRYGELRAQSASIEAELDELKAAIAGLMKRRGFFRAFGRRFEVSLTCEEKWRFPDRKKTLELIRRAGLYERILAPSAPLVQTLMSDPGLDPAHRARLESSAELTEIAELAVRPVGSGGGPAGAPEA